MICSPKIRKYFDSLEEYSQKAHDVASKAREQGFDPDDQVEIQIAKNMAERVVGLISVMAPNIRGCGADERIVELEKEYGTLDWRVALQIALEVAQEKFCKFDTKKEAIETGIRMGFAYGTVGVVSSPLEGFVDLDIKPRRDGEGEYFCINYAGPIRNAGGTAAAWSVIIADYVRKNLGYAKYDPTEDEVKRCATEIEDYHERVTNLQYFPSKEESKFLMENIPIEVGGDASEDFEVSNYKDLPRIPVNKIRSGYCLIHSSCIPLKGPKLWKELNKWGDDFGLDEWNFLEEFLKVQKKAKMKGAKKEEEGAEKPKITPDYTFVQDLVAGRPIVGMPLASGAFRLRYGRSRTSGYSAQSIHPASMFVMDDFVAIGTQFKVERPGKGASFTPCDTIEGPIVKLKSGQVMRLDDTKIAKEVNKEVEEILYLGDVLINYGDFFNRAHILAPAGYCEEWWYQEVEKAIVNMFGELSVEKAADLLNMEPSRLDDFLKNPMRIKPTVDEALIIAKQLSTPLHPTYTYFYKEISAEQLRQLQHWLALGKHFKESNKLTKIVCTISEEKRIAELAGIPHIQTMENVVFEENEARILEAVLLGRELGEGKTGQDLMQGSPIQVRDKSGIFIGSRMGRPEKAKMRKMTGSPHALFPIGEEGGRMRSFQAALQAGRVRSEFSIFKDLESGRETVYRRDEESGNKTIPLYYTKSSGLISLKKDDREPQQTYMRKDVDIKYYFQKALDRLGMTTYPDLIKGIKGTSNKEHIPEHLTKGILRAKHQIYVNKDGTVRCDASELPLTHFKAKEIGVSVEQLIKLGYTTDIKGKPLQREDQIVEIFPQDCILPCCLESPEEPTDEVFFRVCNYVDELLVKVYGLDPFYKLKKKEDLVGHLMIALAPHTSAGMICRIIGFTKSQGFLAHPYLHAAERRDTDGDELGFFMLLDGFLNFSKKFLPGSRGGTMDAPLVLTTILTPGEVDDMAFDVDIVWSYPLEFYEACLDYKMPWDVKIKSIKQVLDTNDQFENMGFTHDTDDFNEGVLCSAYKTLPSMREKLDGQMGLAQKIRAVSTTVVAKTVIEKHFIRDTKGNLRKFSMQVFRCVACNEKYRRPPLRGKCTSCGGKIIFTISEGSVIKYLEPSLALAENYEVDDYLKQSLDLLKRQVEGVFGKEKEKQLGLGGWVE